MAISQNSLILASDMTNFAKKPLLANKTLLLDKTATITTGKSATESGETVTFNISNFQNWIMYSYSLESDSYFYFPSAYTEGSAGEYKLTIWSKQTGASYYAIIGHYSTSSGQTFTANTHYSFTKRSEFIFVKPFSDTYEIYSEIPLPMSVVNSVNDRFRMFIGGAGGSGVVFNGAQMKVYLHIKVYGIL